MKSVLSDDARKRFREILDEVEHHGEQYEVRRYQTPSAVVVPVGWFEQAQAALALLADDTTVALTVRSASQAERLRRIVQDHGSVGMPFPNNVQPTWQVTERGTGEPVNVHGIPSVAARVADGSATG